MKFLFKKKKIYIYMYTGQFCYNMPGGVHRSQMRYGGGRYSLCRD